jgi:hypothetical protein
MYPDPQSLPFVDEHGVEVAAAPEVVWEALCRVAEGSFSSPTAARFARLLGCEPAAPAGPRPLAEGSAIPGFAVAGEPVELWAVSRKIEDSDSEKVDDFWEASPEARQTSE